MKKVNLFPEDSTGSCKAHGPYLAVRCSQWATLSRVSEERILKYASVRKSLSSRIVKKNPFPHQVMIEPVIFRVRGAFRA